MSLNARVLKIPTFHLKGYEDFPREIRKKMQNLFFLCVLVCIVQTFVLVVARITNDFVQVMACIYCLAILGLTFLFIQLKRPVAAGNVALCIIFYVFINFVLRDALSTTFRQMSRINDSTIEIIFGLLLTTTFVIRKSQYIFVVFTSYFVVISHFLVLTWKFYPGGLSSQEITTFVVTLLILSASLFFCLTILSLTSRERGEIFGNIIFYKFAESGPEMILSEHPLQEELELNSGAYFYTLIGQGTQYPTGLFGPVPFGLKQTRQVALIYATRIKDEHLEDPRFANENYFLLTLITTPEKIAIMDRTQLEKDLKRITQDIPDLSLLNTEAFNGIIQRIRAI
ncbi:MAG TPA: hypothetical protein VKK79_22985 [Candidatus Lokiarchaeia archaeon]|nr:hypothetical protein [Candidatus Lokiarchaeia archaeon]